MTSWMDNPDIAGELSEKFPDWKAPGSTGAPVREYVAPVNGTRELTGREEKYARSALESQCADLAAMAKDSGRNDFLNTSAFKMRQYVSSGWLTQNEVVEALLDACRINGLLAEDGQGQCLKTIYSGLRGGGRLGERDVEWKESQVPFTVTEGIEGYGGVNGVAPDAEAEEFDWGGRPGGPMILDGPDTIPALWGKGNKVLWAEGETLMIAGSQGLGKTTFGGLLIRAQLFGGDVLNLPVRPVEKNILYLAMDRPFQIARSMRRQFDETHREILTEKLIMRPGPPFFDIAQNLNYLPEMAKHYDAEVVYIDSLKDAAIGLTDDTTAASYNRARQELLNHGIQLVELHHNIKRNQTGGKPENIADVYGSTWLTSGCGSVVMLTGEPGDPIIHFRHVKQPADEVGPFMLNHNQDTGELTVSHEVDLLELAAHAGADGLTAKGAAAAVFEKEVPTRAEVEKARRRLEALEHDGLLIATEATLGRPDRGGKPRAWFRA